ncbi:hypothetical protein Pla175_44600 [Pirellulimonas nuda]|uniref:Uncharacterized protein n=1 Tax=Pirellulimonas nuda TaxID=2528009 RepID=A0A518DHT9_9BACT|nr:hypothetical protein [Pirellulimonas nuda]QDU91043.1 hypothetical protein Pla175_44600 [Pirellulimonas nuda]
MASKVRYTPEQIIRGIESYFRECGDADTTLDPLSSVYEYHVAASEADGECPLWFLVGLGEHLGLDWGENRWSVLLKLPRRKKSRADNIDSWRDWEERIAPKLTVNWLALAIARRLPGVSFEPVTVLGRRCAPAGAFYGLCSMPELQGRRVAPSTPLRRVLSRSAASRVVRRAAWVSGRDLPGDPLPHGSFSDPTGDVGVLLLIAGFAAVILGVFHGALSLVVSGAAIWLLYAGVLAWSEFFWRLDCWAASGITFRDLAQRIAADPWQPGAQRS